MATSWCWRASAVLEQEVLVGDVDGVDVVNDQEFGGGPRDAHQPELVDQADQLRLLESLHRVRQRAELRLANAQNNYLSSQWNIVVSSSTEWLMLENCPVPILGGIDHALASGMSTPVIQVVAPRAVVPPSLEAGSACQE
jgi:hypothetical protein